MWAMFRRPQILISQLYKYLRHGTGWLMCTMVEMEVFGMSSVVRPNGKMHALSDEQKDPFNPQNRPDFAVMAVSVVEL